MPRAGCPGRGGRSTLEPARTATPRSRDVATNGFRAPPPGASTSRALEGRCPRAPCPARVRGTTAALVVVGPGQRRPAQRNRRCRTGRRAGPACGAGSCAGTPRMGPAAAAAAAAPGLRALLLRPDTPTSVRHADGAAAARRRRAAGSAGRRRGGQGRRALRGRLWGGADLRARRAPLVRPAQRGPRQGRRARCCACSTPPSGRPPPKPSRCMPSSSRATQLLRVRPHELVGEALDADLLVVGGPRTDTGRPTAGRRSSPAVSGLVAHSALHHAPCPVLLAPR